MMSETYICNLPLEVQKYAEDELHETVESRTEGFREIKKWALENPHLNVRTEEKYILPFLRACKFDLDKVKKKLQNYYIMRRDRTEWFNDRNPNLPELKKFLHLGSFLVMRKTHENCMVVMVRPFAHDPKIHTLDNMIKTALMILDVATVEEQLAQVYGVIAIIDLQNLSLAHVKQLSVSRIRNLVYAWENYHVRPQRIQFINGPTYVNVVLDIFKRFMSEKLKSRVFVSYKGQTSLTNIIDKQILPEDYGGDSETLEELGKYWMEKLISNTDWFVEDEQYKAL